MSDGTIELFGQKLSYPATWQGTTAVFIVCTAITIIAFMAKGWATPEVMASLNSNTKQQENINESIVSQLEDVYTKLSLLESSKEIAATQEPGQPAADSVSAAEVAATAREIEALNSQLAISQLKEQITNQRLGRLENVAAKVEPEAVVLGQLKQIQQQQQQQQQLQQQQQQQQQQLQQQQQMQQQM